MPSTLSPLQNSILASVSHSPDAWRLTGGGALAGYHLGHRTTEDLDLFLAGNGVFDEEPRALVSQLVRDGFDVAIVQNAPGFKRYTVSKDQDRVVVDLVADSVDVIEPPTRRPPGVLVDTAQEILTNKLTTLLSRAEVRDLVDVAALVDAGEDLDRALDDAPRKDGGFSPMTLAWVLGQFPLHEAARHGYDEAALRAFRDHLVRLLTD